MIGTKNIDCPGASKSQQLSFLVTHRIS